MGYCSFNRSGSIVHTRTRRHTYRVAQKTVPSYRIANILKTPCVEIGELLQYYMLNTVINLFLRISVMDFSEYLQ